MPIPPLLSTFRAYHPARYRYNGLAFTLIQASAAACARHPGAERVRFADGTTTWAVSEEIRGQPAVVSADAAF